MTLTYSLTYSPTPSATVSFTNTPVSSFTDTFTATGTDTATLTATVTLTASPTHTPVNTETDTASATATITDSPSSSATPTASPTLTVTMTYSASPSPVANPYSVSVDVYNSAGELVDSVYDGPSANPMNQAVVSILGPQANGDPVLVSISGLGTNAGAVLTWGGTNQEGQPVQNGTYYLKMSTTNAFGIVTTTTDPVPVIGAPPLASLEIFNSAGEVVDTLNLPNLAAQPVNLSLLLPAGKNGVVASENPKAVSPSGGVTLVLTLANGQKATEYWDGLSAAGQPLASGNYVVVLSQAEAGSTDLVKTVTLTLLGTQDQSGQAMAESAYVVPNPVRMEGGAFSVEFQGNGVDSAVGELFDLAGERVALAEASPASGRETLYFSARLSGGMYLLDFEVRNSSAALARSVLKVAVVR